MRKDGAAFSIIKIQELMLEFQDSFFAQKCGCSEQETARICLA